VFGKLEARRPGKFAVKKKRISVDQIVVSSMRRHGSPRLLIGPSRRRRLLDDSRGLSLR
jgi:hypothetical protein